MKQFMHHRGQGNAQSGRKLLWTVLKSDTSGAFLADAFDGMILMQRLSGWQPFRPRSWNPVIMAGEVDKYLAVRHLLNLSKGGRVFTDADMIVIGQRMIHQRDRVQNHGALVIVGSFGTAQERRLREPENAGILPPFKCFAVSSPAPRPAARKDSEVVPNFSTRRATRLGG